MNYDIRTTECAQETLERLSGVPISKWIQCRVNEKQYEYNVNDFLANVIRSHGSLPRSYKEFIFIYFHVTTSANDCMSIRKNGLLDLREAYLNNDSELKKFLDQHDIKFNIDKQIMIYHQRKYDISFGECPDQHTEAYKRWRIGRKFFYDFTTCGFLSVWERNPYGGEVHRRPEILQDIDNLLGLNLSLEWTHTHTAYEVTARVSGEKIIYDGDKNSYEVRKAINYLLKAYFTAFGEPSENVLLIKDHVSIPTSDILEIKPLQHWRD